MPEHTPNKESLFEEEKIILNIFDIRMITKFIAKAVNPC
jgi:hypothetical protein